VWSAAIAVACAALLGVLAYGVDGLVSRGRGTPASTVGDSTRAGRTLVGSYARPAVTIAGDDVRVLTPTFSAMAVVTGPLVPGEGTSYQPRFVVGTWTVHIWNVKGNIPLAAADFDTIDHLGTEYRLQPPLGTAMPSAVSTGHAVTFQLRTVVPVGESLFRWAPDGNDIVAKWDSLVEND
jgi:hypothetical protein